MEYGLLNILTKRGCEYKCSYCTYPGIDRQSGHPRDTERVVAALAEPKNNYDVDELVFCYSAFNDPDGQQLELAEAPPKGGLGICWNAFFRPAGISRDEMRRVKRSGLAFIVGSDGASDVPLRPEQGIRF